MAFNDKFTPIVWARVSENAKNTLESRCLVSTFCQLKFDGVKFNPIRSRKILFAVDKATQCHATLKAGEFVAAGSHCGSLSW